MQAQQLREVLEILGKLTFAADRIACALEDISASVDAVDDADAMTDGEMVQLQTRLTSVEG
jgi:hypothetical protein